MKRYKVIADYPNSPFEVGDVLHIDSETNELYGKVSGYVPSKQIVKEDEADKCKAIFKLLNWWEDVPVEELPKYVRYKDGEVIKVNRWEVYGFMVTAISGQYGYATPGITPATESEYNEYLNRK